MTTPVSINPGADAAIPVPWMVTARREQTRDVFTLELAPPAGMDGLRFAPGQFNMLYQFGAGEAPISISGDPARTGALEHTIRAVGGVTRLMASLREGDAIGVRGPYGRGWPMPEAEGKDVVIAAGGIGLAPLRPAVLGILAEREKFGRVVLFYGARSDEDIVFEDDLREWRSRFDMEIEVTVDRGSGGWRGPVGVVTQLIPRAAFDPAKTLAMICGPEVMAKFTVSEFLRLGVEPGRIYVSMERSMKCGVGLCGHCQMGPLFVCKDGPVFTYDSIRRLMALREI
ncbi:MAG: FAD/NAD(P)-binding protein [Candidatus Nitrospinota bacterium M3_3B_026]